MSGIALVVTDFFAFLNEDQVRKQRAYAHSGEKDDNPRGEFKHRRVRNKLHGWLPSIVFNWYVFQCGTSVC